MTRRKGKLIVLLLGLCLTGILLTASLFSWRPLLTQYYLIRLGTDPEYAWQLVGNDEQEPSAMDDALRRFLANPRGRDWFLDQLWKYVIEPPLLRAQANSRKIELGIVCDQGDGKATTIWKFGSRMLSVSVPPPDYERSRKCFALVSRMKCDRLPIPTNREWTVTVKRPERAEFEDFDFQASFSVIPKDLSRYCIIRKSGVASAIESE